jgi:uncharacterized membrane protein YraQ (UPF0718 family)
MKDYLKKHRLHLLVILLYTAFTAGSYAVDFQPGREIFSTNFLAFTREMFLFLPFMFILIGLADVWLSKEEVERHVGENTGIKGIIYVILLSMVQAGPLYGAFPVAFLLWKKGASVRNIFIYLGAFSTLKIPMLLFEIGFLGWKFSIIRTLVTLPVIYLVAILMERYFRGKAFTIREM